MTNKIFIVAQSAGPIWHPAPLRWARLRWDAKRAWAIAARLAIIIGVGLAPTRQSWLRCARGIAMMEQPSQCVDAPSCAAPGQVDT